MHEKYILKILSGPMFGVDVNLPDEKIIHIFFGDDANLVKNNTGNSYDYSINSLLIPGPPGCYEKFLLRVSNENEENKEQEGTKDSFIIAQRIDVVKPIAEAEHDEIVAAEHDASEESPAADVVTDNENPPSDVIIHVPLNQPVLIGQVVVAIKIASDTWSDSVTDYRFPLTHREDQTDHASHSVDEPKRKKPLYYRLIAMALIVCGCAFILFLVMLPNKIMTLKEALVPVNPEIVQSKDGRIFILAATLPEAKWTEMALRKSELVSNNITILSAPEEKDKIKHLLIENVVPFFDVKFVGSFALRVLISQERAPKLKGYESQLQHLLTTKFPYLTAVNIERVSDSTVDSNASSRLKSLGLYSQRDMAKDHITLNISGELDDFQLSTLRRQVREFYEQYGDQYVKFVVNMNEDPLRNRTFKTGNDSYIVAPDSHWLYSDITSTQIKY